MDGGIKGCNVSLRNALSVGGSGAGILVVLKVLWRCVCVTLEKMISVSQFIFQSHFNTRCFKTCFVGR